MSRASKIWITVGCIVVGLILLGVIPVFVSVVAAVGFVVGLVWLFRRTKYVRRGPAVAIVAGSLVVFGMSTAVAGGRTAAEAPAPASKFVGTGEGFTPAATPSAPQCATPAPTVTVTATATSTASASASVTAPRSTSSRTPSPTGSPCPTSTAIVFVALHHDGEVCTTDGGRYTAAGVDLVCVKNAAGSLVWTDKATDDQRAADAKKAQDAEAARVAEEQRQAAIARQQQAPAPAPAAPAPAAPAPAPASVYYANCTAVRAAGAAPLYAGQPGYRSGLDRDGDGIACEK